MYLLSHSHTRAHRHTYRTDTTPSTPLRAKLPKNGVWRKEPVLCPPLLQARRAIPHNSQRISTGAWNKYFFVIC